MFEEDFIVKSWGLAAGARCLIWTLTPHPVVCFGKMVLKLTDVSGAAGTEGVIGYTVKVYNPGQDGDTVEGLIWNLKNLFS